MKRIILLIYTLFLSVLSGGANNHTGIDIIHTDLHVYVSVNSPSLRGDVHYSAVILDAELDMFEFNSYWLQVDSAFVDWLPVAITPPGIPEDETFFINLPEEFSVGDTVFISIFYRRTESQNAPERQDTREGYYYFPAGMQKWGQTAQKTIGYTMSQPNDARAWFPTIDIPSNKSTLTLRITVDQPSNVIANGTKESTVNNPDGSVTHTFHHDYPIPPYLTAFTVGNYNEYVTFYEADDGRSIPVASYLFQEDGTWADPANSLMVGMLGMFEEMFGSYPFERYGMIAIEPFLYGGMEHQTVSAMRRSLFLNERVIAHELAHQWWGNMVTCESWSDIWLNEGFASFSEILYEETVNGSIAARQALNAFAQSYFFEDTAVRYALYDPPPNRLFGTAIYRKGAWVLHMLRKTLGDQSFFAALREYGERHRYATATTASLQQTFEEISGQPLDWFFDQWVYQSGYPVYTLNVYIKEKEEDGTVPVSLTLRQLQTNALPAFTGNVTFAFRFGDGDTTVTFWNSERTQEFLLSLPDFPDTVLFDPDLSILHRYEGVTVVDENESQIPETVVLYQNYPNPFNAVTVIQFSLPERMHVRLRITDFLGRLVAEPVNEIREAGTYSHIFDAGEHATGIYFTILDTGGVQKTRKMIYLR
jgi:aminopeptidase N